MLLIERDSRVAVYVERLVLPVPVDSVTFVGNETLLRAARRAIERIATSVDRVAVLIRADLAARSGPRPERAAFHGVCVAQKLAAALFHPPPIALYGCLPPRFASAESVRATSLPFIDLLGAAEGFHAWVNSLEAHSKPSGLELPSLPEAAAGLEKLAARIAEVRVVLTLELEAWVASPDRDNSAVAAVFESRAWRETKGICGGIRQREREANEPSAAFQGLARMIDGLGGIPRFLSAAPRDRDERTRLATECLRRLAACEGLLHRARRTNMVA